MRQSNRLVIELHHLALPLTAPLEYLRGRMLKNSASSVLASFRPSTYLREYAPGLRSLRPCWTILLSILQSVLPLSRACARQFLSSVLDRIDVRRCFPYQEVVT